MRFRGYGRPVLALTLLLGTMAAAAQDDRVQELERKLQQRDQVIHELLERVEILERRVGIAPAHPAAPAGDPESAVPSGATPGRVEVTARDAERALERSLTREGALLLPAGVLELEPGIRYSRREQQTPAHLTLDAVEYAGQVARNTDSLSASLALRLGLPWDAQLEAELPYRWRQVDSVASTGFAPTASGQQTGDGLGDLRLGLAKTLLLEGRWLPDLVGRLTVDTATGSAVDNGVALGGGAYELTASLAAIKRQDPIAFSGGLAYTRGLERHGIRPGQAVTASFGGFLALSPETSLRLAMSATRQWETRVHGTGIDGSDRLSASLILGGSSLVAPGVLLNLTAGIGLTRDAEDFSVLLSLPVRLNQTLF